MLSEKTIEKELVKALPVGLRDDPRGQYLARLVTRVSDRKVPVSSFSRLWTLGSLQARIAALYLAYWLRGRFVDPDRRQEMKSETQLAAAIELLGTMGYLRGAVMKVGQMLAHLPEVVPEEVAEVLSALHFEAPPLHFAMVRELFLDEFGTEPEKLFASFERQAFAAASLGQVHRARLKTGEEVAVKIQYPGIGRTIRADLSSLRLLVKPLSRGKQRQDMLEKLADIEQMLIMETDYRQEADFCRQVRELFADEDRVVVPRVFDEYSTERVLTTEYLAGSHLNRFLATEPSQGERDHFTTLLTLATMRVYYRLHWFMADPHPGNFLFMPDGRLGLIDFGCIRAITDDEWLVIHELEEAALAGDQERVDRVIAKACGLDGPEAMEPEQLEQLRRGASWNMEPWLNDGLFDFGDRDFFVRGINGLVETSRKNCPLGAPLYLWSTRFVVGGRAVCYRMKGRCEFANIFREESAISLARDHRDGRLGRNQG